MMNKVVFGIETTDISRNCDILKIAIVDVEDCSKIWTQDLHPIQSKRLETVSTIGEETNCESVYGKIALPGDGMIKFLSYLVKNYPDGVNLVAHNGYHFDFPHLKRYLDKFIPHYKTTYTIHWTDSIKVFKKHFPGSESYTKLFLAERFSSEQYLKKSNDVLSYCLAIRNAMKCASQEKGMSIVEFLGSSMPFSFVTSPYIEKKVIFDLETTGFRRNCEILQIALVDVNDNSKFWNQYFQPMGPIDPKATEINQLSLGIDSMLCYRGLECENVVKASEGIKRFKNYLMCNYPEGAILVAHNGDIFDFPVLKRYLETYDQEFCNNKDKYPIDCIDSLGAFQRHFRGLSSYKQECLMTRFAKGKSLKDAHDALGDCLNLRVAINAAAFEKNLTVAQFLGESLKKQSLWLY